MYNLMKENEEYSMALLLATPQAVGREVFQQLDGEDAREVPVVVLVALADVVHTESDECLDRTIDRMVFHALQQLPSHHIAASQVDWGFVELVLCYAVCAVGDEQPHVFDDPRPSVGRGVYGLADIPDQQVQWRIAVLVCKKGQRRGQRIRARGTPVWLTSILCSSRIFITLKLPFLQAYSERIIRLAHVVRSAYLV